MNMVILHGRLSRAAERRVLASGDELVACDVTVPRAGDRAESVPVVWPDAPASALTLEPGVEVVVVGRVRRRFFRAGGATQTRTEVVAEGVVPARHAKRARRLLADALAVLEQAAS